MAAPAYSLAEIWPKNTKSAAQRLRFLFSSFYICFIKLRRVKYHEYGIYFCLRMSRLREMEGVLGLDKILAGGAIKAQRSPPVSSAV